MERPDRCARERRAWSIGQRHSSIGNIAGRRQIPANDCWTIPDRAEVIGDLERSVGDRLAALVGAEDRLIATEDIDAILEEVGAVDTGRDPAPNESGRAPRTVRRLYRVREGKELAGVCTGLAAYSEIPVDWVRTIFVIGTLVTAGLLGLVYLALAFILPIEARPAPHP